MPELTEAEREQRRRKIYDRFSDAVVEHLSRGTVQWNDFVNQYRESEKNVPYFFRMSKLGEILRGLPTEEYENGIALEAQRDVYGCWWRFLTANPEEYPPRGKARGEAERTALHSKFDDLGDEFRDWWSAHGKDLFREKLPAPIITLIEPERYVSGQETPEYITVRIPMNMRRERILLQLRTLLELFKPGDQYRRHQHSTAKQTLFPRQRYDPEHYDKLLRVWQHCQPNERKPEGQRKPWWMLGEELNLAPALITQNADVPSRVAEKHNELGTMTRRLYQQAERMMWHALRGRFPCDDPIPGQ